MERDFLICESVLVFDYFGGGYVLHNIPLGYLQMVTAKLI